MNVILKAIADLALLVFVVGVLLLGYFLGGPGSDTKGVLGLATGQRNIAAAMLVASRNFGDPMVIVTFLVVTLLGLFIQMPLAITLGKRSPGAENGRPLARRQENYWEIRDGYPQEPGRRVFEGPQPGSDTHGLALRGHPWEKSWCKEWSRRASSAH